MPISPASPLNGGNSSPNVPKKELSPDDFIKVFIAQMQNQNPMHPTDSSAILTQMANISSISASHDLQAGMKQFSKDMNMTMANSQVLEATQLIGKDVEIPSKTGMLKDTGNLNGCVYVPKAASAVTVLIKDSAGNTVRKIDCGPTSTDGLVDFAWDGTNGVDTKTRLAPGMYNLSATATIDGKTQEIHTASGFNVKSVGLDPSSGKLTLNVDGLGGVSMSDILKIL